ncbi:MAG: ATP synthase F0 subunit C [Proteobacteria bacterium]|jgi:F-type H+-transporting ATPase subunit c|nr:ATP synthase F0 subunit C [Pseudomonadota bacterium]
MEGLFYAKAAAFLGAAIAMGLGSVGPAIGQGLVGTKACESIGKYPESADKIRMTMMIAMAIIESSAIYAFLIALLLIIFNR